jgi:hypothetical protein
MKKSIAQIAMEIRERGERLLAELAEQERLQEIMDLEIELEEAQERTTCLHSSQSC